MTRFTKAFTPRCATRTSPCSRSAVRASATAQHDHMIIGRNEIAVQHMIKVFAQELGVALA